MKFKELFEGKKPQDVLRKFYEISQIPRVPGDQKQISDYIVNWAKRLGFEVDQDKTLNVLVKKPASKGMELQEPIILQAHLDMVCESDPGVKHNFYTDPLDLIVDGDIIKAKGTTLGADDGIGVATIMALLEDDSFSHPSLEALFTIDEETDMKGAWNFDCLKLKGKILINLDAFAIMIAGGGELEYCMHLPKKIEEIKKGSEVMKITVGGLIGGHTGYNSMQERGSAVQLLSRILQELDAKSFDYQVLYMQAGKGLSSAFARNGDLLVGISEDKIDDLNRIIEDISEVFKDELKLRDPNVKITVQRYESSDIEKMDKAFKLKKVFTRETLDNLKTLLLLLPDGLSSINQQYKNAMETTTNVGVIETEENEIYITTLIRSFVESKKMHILEKVKKICELFEIQHELSYNIPHWENCVSEELLKKAKMIYTDSEVTVTQGTLETGIFYEHIPDVQIIALSCPYYNAHSPQEYLKISEIEEYTEKIKKFIEIATK